MELSGPFSAESSLYGAAREIFGDLIDGLQQSADQILRPYISDNENKTTPPIARPNRFVVRASSATVSEEWKASLIPLTPEVYIVGYMIIFPRDEKLFIIPQFLWEHRYTSVVEKDPRCSHDKASVPYWPVPRTFLVGICPCYLEDGIGIDGQGILEDTDLRFL